MVIDTEVRQALHEIRDQLQRRTLHTEINTQRIEHHTERIDKLEQMLQEHLSVCNRQQDELAQILEVVRNVNASMKVANMVRRVVIWVGGLAAACFSLYRAYKGQ